MEEIVENPIVTEASSKTNYAYSWIWSTLNDGIKLWKTTEVTSCEPYIIEKDYGDIMLCSPVYADASGHLFIRRDAIDNLPSDVSADDFDVDTWLELDYGV